MSRNICVWIDEVAEDVQLELRQRIQKTADQVGFSVRFFDSEEEVLPHLAECEVFYGHSPQLAHLAPQLKWFCCSWAGVEPFCKEGVFQNPECILTNSSGSYGDTISEHCFMVMLMLLRQMPAIEAELRQRKWEGDVPIRSILGSRMTVLGAGDIGTAVARRAKAFGAAHITGVSRSGKARSDVYDEMLPITRLEEALPRTDILVMAMPGTAETVGLMSAQRLALLPASAIVVNVGRGYTLDQAALCAALSEGRLSGAALDVFQQEPIPADDPTWETPNLLITPHMAGRLTLRHTAIKNAEMFCEDLENYAAGRPLIHAVDRKRGY